MSPLVRLCRFANLGKLTNLFFSQESRQKKARAKRERQKMQVYTGDFFGEPGPGLNEPAAEDNYCGFGMSEQSELTSGFGKPVRFQAIRAAETDDWAIPVVKYVAVFSIIALFFLPFFLCNELDAANKWFISVEHTCFTVVIKTRPFNIEDFLLRELGLANMQNGIFSRIHCVKVSVMSHGCCCLYSVNAEIFWLTV